MLEVTPLRNVNMPSIINCVPTILCLVSTLPGGVVCLLSCLVSTLPGRIFSDFLMVLDPLKK